MNDVKIPWIIKYCPKKLNDIIYHKNKINILKNLIDKNLLSHMIFYGSNGIGKTSLINIICNEIYKDNISFKQNCLKIDVTNLKGINIVREEMKNFSRRILHENINNKIKNNYKIIIIDNIEILSKESQSALRRILEKYSKNTRFIIICNNLNKIIKPILSRCIKLSFEKIPDNLILKHLNKICKLENFDINKNYLEIISKNSNGNLNKCINILEMLKKLNDNQKKITINYLYSILGKCKIEVNNFFNFIKFNNYNNILEYINNLLCKGYNTISIINSITEYILLNKNINNNNKKELLIFLFKMSTNINKGSNIYLEFLNFAKFYKNL